jgi:ribonuclease BN (tRNA processing enzyme)
MRLTALGTGTIALTASRVCAGHLVEHAGVRVLLDCGSGVTHRLAEHSIDWMGITHVAITHFHTDHVGDLPTLIFAWKYGALPSRSAPVEIIGPPGIAALLHGMAGAFGSWVTAPGFPLVVRELPPGDALELGDGVRLESAKVPHTEESVAYSVGHDARRVVYSGDTGYDPALGAWAAGCDVLLCECSLPDAMAIPQHLTPRECGRLAALATPRLLALTHLYPPVEQVDIRGEVAEAYRGPVEIVWDGWAVDVDDL